MSRIISISGASNSGKTYLINSLQQIKKFQSIYYFPSNSSAIFKALESIEVPGSMLSLNTTQRLICDIMIGKLQNLSENLNEGVTAICDRSIFDNYIFTKYLYKKKQITKETYFYVQEKFINNAHLISNIVVLSNEKIEIKANGYREKTVGIDPEFNKFFLKQASKLKKKFANIEIIKTPDNKRRLRKLKQFLNLDNDLM